MEEHLKSLRRGEEEGKLRKTESLRSKPVRPGRRGQHDIDELILAPTPPTQETIDRAEPGVLINALKQLRDPEGFAVNPGQDCDRFQRIVMFLQSLISRGHPRDPFIYECMVDAMADTKGSKEGLRRILVEMEEKGIPLSATICQSALAALAVHPSYALRQQVLDTMREFWYEMGKGSRENNLVAMLREGQYELAYDKLMGMLEEGQLFPLWLYDIFVLEFGNQGFLDEMISLLFRRKQAKGTDSVAVGLTYYCLDMCSRALHYQGTSYAWNSGVRDGIVNPSDGILENVLATAAREGDVSLAAEIHGIISGRRRVQIHHYDALAEAFVNDGDIKGALRILFIAKQNGLKVLRENTRVLYSAMVNNPEYLHDAHVAIRDLATKESVSVGAVSVVLEAAAKTGRDIVARTLYEDFKSLTGQRRGATIIEDMIINTDDADHRGAYIKDYNRLVPNDREPLGHLGPAYKKLINACLDFEEWDLAVRFAQAAFVEYDGFVKQEVPHWLKRLTTLCIQNKCKRIWRLHDECVRGGNQAAITHMQNVARKAREEARLEEEKEKEAGATLEASMPDEDVYAQTEQTGRGAG